MYDEILIQKTPPVQGQADAAEGQEGGYAGGQVSMADRRALSRREVRLRELGNDFGFLGILSIAYGIMASFCLYHNPLGIAVPVFAAVSYGVIFLVLKRIKVKIKKGSLFLGAVTFLIGLSTCFTTNVVVGYHMNRLAMVLLFCIFILHQFHEDGKWNVGKYVTSILIYLAQALSMIYCPFTHLIHFIRSIKSRKYRTVLRLLAGVCAAVPAMIILSLLLASADMVFQNMLDTVIEEFLNPFTLFPVTLQAVAWTLTLYCLVCSAWAGEISDDTADRQCCSPVAAISFMSMIAAVYLVFCGIQIVYLFMGRGSLPWGMTYSDYARQGFFQLLFVAVLNLVMVLMCIKYCREHVLLKAILLVISLCTYVMIASAVYRMMLYVQQYHLTFLRVLVLWFLAMLVVLMAGVVLLIFNRAFPLFRFCLVAISVFYLGFAWIKPDYVIARYNVEHGACQGEEGLGYFAALSSDAAPVVAGLKDLEKRDELLRRYARIYDYVDNGAMGLRTCNFSALKARKLWVQVQE